jgi:hypothetical protein
MLGIYTDPDPDPDPAIWIGSDPSRTWIHNTAESPEKFP